MNVISWPLVGYVLRAAVRDRLVIALLIVIALMSALSVFLGSAAYIEKYEFVLVFAASGTRILSVLGLVLFCVFYLRRSFDNKDVDYLLSRPISRVSFILSHAIAFSLIAALMALASSVAVYMTAPVTLGPGHVMWAVSLMFELIIMANAALFFAMVLTSASTSAMVVLALYVLARTIGILLGIVQSSLIQAPWMKGLSFVMEAVSFIIPRLDLMAQTSWLVYSPQTISLGFICAQGIIFSLLLIAASMVDLVRRQF